MAFEFFRNIFKKKTKPVNTSAHTVPKVITPYELAQVIIQNEADFTDYLHDYHQLFIWAEYGDEVEQWNDNISPLYLLPQVTISYDSNQKLNTLKYRNKTVAYIGTDSRDDNLIAVFNLSYIVADDIELRIINITTANSEQAFLPLTAQQWLALEQSFSIEIVESIFTKAADNIDDFWSITMTEAYRKS